MSILPKSGITELVGGFISKSSDVAREKAPTLMTIGAAVGLGLTVYEALKAKPKCDDILAERAGRLEELEVTEEGAELTEEAKKDEIRKINIDTGVKFAKAIARPVIVGGTTIGLMFGANYINLRRLADVTALYDISSEALRKYKNKTKEVVGETKEAEIRNQIAQEDIDETYHPNSVIQTKGGDVLFRDALSGRYFRSSRAAVDKAVNEINYSRNADYGFVSLNEFYYMLHIPEIKLGEELGWMPENGLLEVQFSYGSTPDGIPCCIIDYNVFMRHRFGDD